jgi:hypothetical protein
MWALSNVMNYNVYNCASRVCHSAHVDGAFMDTRMSVFGFWDDEAGIGRLHEPHLS